MVTSGQYSDFTVHAVFDNESEAEKYARGLWKHYYSVFVEKGWEIFSCVEEVPSGYDGPRWPEDYTQIRD